MPKSQTPIFTEEYVKALFTDNKPPPDNLLKFINHPPFQNKFTPENMQKYEAKCWDVGFLSTEQGHTKIGKVTDFGKAIRFVENVLCPRIGQKRREDKVLRNSSSYSKNIKLDQETKSRDYSGLINLMEDKRKADNKSVDEFYTSQNPKNSKLESKFEPKLDSEIEPKRRSPKTQTEPSLGQKRKISSEIEELALAPAKSAIAPPKIPKREPTKKPSYDSDKIDFLDDSQPGSIPTVQNVHMIQPRHVMQPMRGYGHINSRQTQRLYGSTANYEIPDEEPQPLMENTFPKVSALSMNLGPVPAVSSLANLPAPSTLPTVNFNTLAQQPRNMGYQNFNRQNRASAVPPPVKPRQPTESYAMLEAMNSKYGYYQ